MVDCLHVIEGLLWHILLSLWSILSLVVRLVRRLYVLLTHLLIQLRLWPLLLAILLFHLVLLILNVLRCLVDRNGIRLLVLPAGLLIAWRGSVLLRGERLLLMLRWNRVRVLLILRNPIGMIILGDLVRMRDLIVSLLGKQS